MKNTAKKTLALLLTMLMLVGLAVPMASATTTLPSYSEAEEGDLLYTADFSAADAYDPDFMTKADGTTATASQDGKSVTVAGSGETFYGAAVSGFAFARSVYTITYVIESAAGTNAGMYFDAANETAGNNGIFGTDAALSYYAGTTKKMDRDYVYAEHLMTAEDLSSDDDMVARKYKMIVDGIGGTLIAFVLTDADNDRYEKLWEISLKKFQQEFKGDNLCLILRANGTNFSVKLSDVNVYKGGIISVNAPGQLLLEVDDVTDVVEGSNGVVYTPSLDGMYEPSRKDTFNKFEYRYDEVEGASVFNTGTDPKLTQHNADIHRYDWSHVFGGNTNLRFGTGNKYTITYSRMMNANCASGGDSGLAFITGRGSEERFVAFNQQTAGFGSYLIGKAAGSRGEYVTNNTASPDDGLVWDETYVNYTIEINGTIINAWANDTQVVINKDLSTYHNSDYGLLSLGMWVCSYSTYWADWDGRELSGLRETGTAPQDIDFAYFKDLKVYSGLTKTNKYVPVERGEFDTVLTVDATVETFTLPSDKTAGYVFKGWKVNDGTEVLSAGDVVQVADLEMLTPVYDDILTVVGYQFAEAANNAQDVRIVGVIDSIKYKAIGYDIVIEYGNNQSITKTGFELKNVYESLTADYGEAEITLESLGYPADGGYLTAFVIKGVPTNVGEITIKITPYTVNFSDAKTTGEMQTVTLYGAN